MPLRIQLRVHFVVGSDAWSSPRKLSLYDSGEAPEAEGRLWSFGEQTPGEQLESYCGCF